MTGTGSVGAGCTGDNVTEGADGERRGVAGRWTCVCVARKQPKFTSSLLYNATGASATERVTKTQLLALPLTATPPTLLLLTITMLVMMIIAPVACFTVKRTILTTSI